MSCSRSPSEPRTELRLLGEAALDGDAAQVLLGGHELDGFLHHMAQVDQLVG